MDDFMDIIRKTIIAEMEKCVPEEVKKDMHEMAALQVCITERLHKNLAIPEAAVNRFNVLCYKHFGKVQDGAEFVKEKAPPAKTEAKGGNAIPYAERKRVYEVAIDRYGIKPQLMMVIEEASELVKELCKYFRGPDNLDKIADEAADLTIMLEQLRLIFNLNDEVCKHMDAKVERLAGKLGIEVQHGGSEVQ